MRKIIIAVKVAALGFLLCLFYVLPADAFVVSDKVSTAKSLTHYAMGYIYDLSGSTEKAILEYEQAAQFDELSYLIRLRLGTGYARLNMLNEAVSELQMASHYNPEDLQAHYLLALIYSTAKEYSKAAEEYEYILKTFSETEPQNIEIYGYLGQLYYSQKKYHQAAQQFEKILEIEPDNADILYLLGVLYVEMKEWDNAVRVLSHSIEVNPTHDGSLNTLGYIYAENGHHLDEAEQLIKKALEVNPNNGAYLDSLGWVYFKKGEYEKAVESLKAADAVLKDPVIYSHLGDVYLKLNNRDEAVKYWELSLKLWPEQKQLRQRLEELKNIQVMNE